MSKISDKVDVFMELWLFVSGTVFIVSWCIFQTAL